MGKYDTAKLRNLGIVAHGGAGKTSLTGASVPESGIILDLKALDFVDTANPSLAGPGINLKQYKDIEEFAKALAPHITRWHLATLAAPRGAKLLARRGRLTEKDLEDQTVLLLEDGHCLRDQALAVCERGGAAEHDVGRIAVGQQDHGLPA